MTIYKKMSHGKTHLYGRTEAGEEYIGPEDDPTKWDRKITTKILEKENKKIQDSISRYLDDVQLLTLYMPEPERKEYLSKRSAELLARLRQLEPEMKKDLEIHNIRNNNYYLQTIKTYNIPPFVLEKIAIDSNSNFIKKGTIENRLGSMNDSALKLIHRVFVDCADDPDGIYANYRFIAYIASMFFKCEILLNEKIPGASGKIHKVPVAVKSNGMYIAVALNKSKGDPVSKREAIKFYEMMDDIKKGKHGNQIAEGILGSSVGFEGEALVTLEKLSESRKKDSKNKTYLKTANFENRVYSVTQY